MNISKVNENLPRRKGFEVHGPPMKFQPDNRGVGEVVFECLTKHGEKICQVCSRTGREETFSSVKQRCIRLAEEMKKRGITRKDVILMCSLNNMDTLIPFLATQLIGAIIASLDPNLSARDMRYLLGTFHPKLTFVDAQSLPVIKELFKENQIDTEIIIFDGDHEGCTQFSELMKSSPEENSFKPEKVKSDETALIVFSSGTTGFPKGMCISNYSVLYCAMSLLGLELDFNSLLHFTTFYWISAINITYLGLLNGSRRVINPIFTPSTAFKIIQDFKVTFAFMAYSYAYQFKDEDVTSYDLSCFKNLYLGGAAVAEKQLKWLRSLMPDTNVAVCYGNSESGGFLTGIHKSFDFRLCEAKLNNCGHILGGFKMKIVDVETREDLPPERNGELLLKTPSLISGYYNVPSIGLLDENGWFKTGDIAFFDENNFLYIVDRIKEMFKFQSWHIVPASLESVLHEHPAIHEAVVVGLRDEINDNNPAAIVVLKEKYKDVTSEEIRNFFDERVLDREKLRGGVYIVKSIPRTPTGKVQRRNLRDKIEAGEL